MGSWAGRPDERPVHSVTVGRFRLARTPVTNEQYAAFVESGLAPAPPWWRDPAFAAPGQPVVGVTWFEAASYAAWLSETLGGRWRLPTEAEWERAMRGGLLDAATAWGDALPEGEVPEGAISGPWPVGRGTPNGFGLLDPGTVVHEWCADRYAPYGSQEAGGLVRDEPTDAVVPGTVAAAAAARPGGEATARAVERKVSRGGSWRHRQRWSPPAARSSLPPGFRYADYGFRVLGEED
jgi:formylglycine-generating enzyme required for sulfatase activity